MSWSKDSAEEASFWHSVVETVGERETPGEAMVVLEKLRPPREVYIPLARGSANDRPL